MKETLGILAVIVGFIGYIPYFRTIFSGKTKPHAFSWLVWGTLTGIAFVSQVAGNGGAGAWVTGFTALISFTIFGLALFKGVKDFPLTDWLCLAGSIIAIALWALTKNPLIAVVLITIIDFVAFLPTIRKSYSEPNSEPIFTYSLSGLKFLIGIIALTELSWLTVLYPASLVMANGGFVVMLLIRRNKLAQEQSSLALSPLTRSKVTQQRTHR
ncbi:hypothetical protein IPL85_00865 [Candidatus Saccharibacteria bacterium]|nr:MAG: hypothetical protein IPL85_00865 [Candidatus Saccharibacteria bacterium]